MFIEGENEGKIGSTARTEKEGKEDARVKEGWS